MLSTQPTDQHGNPLPTEESLHPLGTDQIDDALAALPGWEHSADALCRDIPVPADSIAGLREGIGNVVLDPARLHLEETEQGLVVRLGSADAPLSGADLETAARIDAVLSGSARDMGAAD